MIRKHEMRHLPGMTRYCFTGAEEAAVVAPAVEGGGKGAAAAAPGWVSAEGGAGYAGGLAADAAAGGAAGAAGLAPEALPAGGASVAPGGIVSPVSEALGLGANVVPSAGSSAFAPAAAGAAEGAAAADALTPTNVAPSATPTGGQIGTPSASAPEAPAGASETPGLPAQPVQGTQTSVPGQTASPAELQQPAPISEGASQAAPVTDQARLAAQGLSAATQPAQQANSVMKALKSLGLVDDKGGIGRNALPALGLIASQIRAAQSGNTLSKQLTAAGQRTGAAADTLLGQGLSGQVSPAIQASIMQQVKDQKEAVRQQYANMGRDPNTDTGALAAMAKIDMQAQALIAQQAQALTSQGLQAAGMAQGPSTQAALAAAQQDQALSQSMASVLQQMAMLEALQSRGTAPAAA